MLCAPVAAPNVHVVLICPAALVTPVAGATEPPPVDTANVTVCPATGFPNTSLTLTSTGCANAAFTTPDWPPPPASASVVAALGATSNAVLTALATVAPLAPS